MFMENVGMEKGHGATKDVVRSMDMSSFKTTWSNMKLDADNCKSLGGFIHVISRRYGDVLAMDGAKELLGRMEDGEFDEMDDLQTGQRWDSHATTCVDKLLEDTRPKVITSKGEQDKNAVRTVTWANEEDTSEWSDGEDIMEDYIMVQIPVPEVDCCCRKTGRGKGLM